MHGNPVTGSACPALSSIPYHLCPSAFTKLTSLVSSLNVCVGHPDSSKIIDLAKSRKGKLASAFLDNYAPVTLKGTIYAQTVRTLACEYLVQGTKCSVCIKYRSTLRSMYSRQQKQSLNSPSSSHANDRFMHTPQLSAKMKRLRQRLSDAEREAKRAKIMLNSIMEKNGVSIDTELEDDLTCIMRENTEKVRQECPDDTFRRIFWEEQLAVLMKKDKRQIRWHPLMIRWCLNLKLISSAAYHCVRTSGMLNLPSERTLRDYSNYIQTKSGYQHEVMEQLCNEAKIETLDDPRKHVSILVDEMKVKESLVYNKFNGKIIGFVDLGSFTNEVLEKKLQNTCNRLADHPPIADHILVLMVRGIFIRLNFPLAHFPTKNISGFHLFPIIWEGIELLEGAGFKVISITADGASPNRTFFKMHSKLDKSVYKTDNPYTTENRPIFFISDVPHLIKTARNCFSHSFGHGRTRQLWVHKYYS